MQICRSYDANGNMTSEKDKNITAIAYNFLNLPNQVTQTTAPRCRTIASCGHKVKTKNPTFRSWFYRRRLLRFYKKAYIYNYTDHLGNVRLSYYKNNAGVLTIVEENNYYPFDLKAEETTDWTP